MTIERVAKAIADVQDVGVGDIIREEARAALEAIAEPTPEMIDEGNKAAGDYIEKPRPGMVRVIWRAMTAAMLKEKEANDAA